MNYRFQIIGNKIHSLSGGERSGVTQGDENSSSFSLRAPKTLVKGDIGAYVFCMLVKLPGKEMQRFSVSSAKCDDEELIIEWDLPAEASSRFGKTAMQLEIVGNKFAWRSEVYFVQIGKKIEEILMEEEKLILDDYLKKEDYVRYLTPDGNIKENLPAGTDLNSMEKSGMYFFSSAENAPTGVNASALFVLVLGNIIYQGVFASNGKFFSRSKNFGFWNAWV